MPFRRMYIADFCLVTIQTSPIHRHPHRHRQPYSPEDKPTHNMTDKGSVPLSRIYISVDMDGIPCGGLPVSPIPRVLLLSSSLQSDKLNPSDIKHIRAHHEDGSANTSSSKELLHERHG